MLQIVCKYDLFVVTNKIMLFLVKMMTHVKNPKKSHTAFLGPKSLFKWRLPRIMGLKKLVINVPNIGCFVLHNSKISDRQKWLQRQLSSDFWECDTHTRICLESWQRF